MELFDSAWPPRTCEVRADAVVPMFPLPGAFLFPGQLMPLHVFEPRYRQMIEDSLDRSGRLVIATVREQDRDRLAGAPPVLASAGLGEIARHQKLEDGRFLLWLCGLARVRIDEVPSERLYRQVRVTPLAEVAADEADDRQLRPQLLEAIQRRTGTDLGEHGEVALGALADVLVQCLVLPEPILIDLHGELDVAERARKALSAEQRFPRAGAGRRGG